MTMEIRKVSLNDVGTICDIYNYYVKNTVFTFETEPVSEYEMKQRITEIVMSGMPFFVGDIDGRVVGYCYIDNWHKRNAYSKTKEVTIYIDNDQIGRGFGSLMFEHLLNIIDKSLVHVLLGVICIPNKESVALHEKFGFKQVSFLKEVGWKFNQWRDIGHWQLIL